MSYKLRYSRQFQNNNNETMKVELEEEFDDTIAPSDAVRLLLSKIDKSPPQLVENRKVLGINSPVQTENKSLWQPWDQYSK